MSIVIEKRAEKNHGPTARRKGRRERGAGNMLLVAVVVAPFSDSPPSSPFRPGVVTVGC